ncbi:MAG: hypothetical protein M1838_004479 [Thelocarpon superellum]|nr:MAG: hypothetical protein M1838_004479 [Thelocarpon superellum]
MPSIQYLNQSAPFWDFVASFENQAFEEKSPKEDAPASGEESKQPPEGEAQRDPCQGAQGRHGPCGGRRGGRGFRGGHHGGPPFHRGGPPFAAHPFFRFMNAQFNNGQEESEGKDFQPPVDVFSTESSYHVHVSIPGAKKEDVGVNWDADKSELSVAGVIYRPGDEEFLKTLAMGERKVGVFERKVKLGNERHPAEVDADVISAKMEDGVLKIEIPKVEKEYVEVKKVDIE